MSLIDIQKNADWVYVQTISNVLWQQFLAAQDFPQVRLPITNKVDYLFPWKSPAGGKGKSDSRVEMGTGDMTNRVNQDHHS